MEEEAEEEAHQELAPQWNPFAVSYDSEDGCYPLSAS